MASIEQTQVALQTIVVTTVDTPTGYFYVQLGNGTAPPAGTVFVIKSMIASISSTTPPGTFSATAPVTTATSNDGTTVSNIIRNYLNTEDYITILIIGNINVFGNVIINEPYLAINPSFTATGTYNISVVITYLEIPLTSPLVNNFFVVAGTVPVSSTETNTIIFTPTQTNSAIISSFWLTNTDGINDCIVNTNLTNTSAINNAWIFSVTVNPLNSFPLLTELYLNTTSGGGINNLALLTSSTTSTTPLNYYLSYTLDPYA